MISSMYRTQNGSGTKFPVWEIWFVVASLIVVFVCDLQGDFSVDAMGIIAH